MSRLAVMKLVWALVLAVAIIFYWIVTLSKESNTIVTDTIAGPVPVTSTSSSSSLSPQPSEEEADNGTSWNDLKNKLCPNMVPNLDFSVTLFQAASEATGRTRHFPSPETVRYVANNFYNGNFADVVQFNAPHHNAIAFVPIWKCAHTQIRSYLKKYFGQPQKFEAPHAPTQNHHHHNNSNSTGDDPKSVCVITAIRDPISHFLSGYNELETRIEGDEYMELKRMTNRFRNKTLGSKNRFAQYVVDVLTDSKYYGYHKHVFSMSRILPVLQDHGQTLTGYLPSIHNLTYTFPAFLRNTCPGVDEVIPNAPMPKKGQHESSNDPLNTYQAAKDVWHDGGRIARALCILLSMDYACWEDLPGGIPNFCQEVYSSSSFASLFV